MGNTKIRKLINQESKWTDKSVAKHKHDFSVRAIVHVHMNSEVILTYGATKCTQCSSFVDAKSISSKLNRQPLAGEEIHLYSPHKWIIGFKDIKLKR
jgi:hypothetical protein